MTCAEIIGIIKENGLENEILEYLVRDRIRYIKRKNIDYETARATINCIKATNRGKDKAIDALCEPESEVEKRRKYRLLGADY